MAAAHEEEKAAVEIHTAALGDELAAAELHTVSPVDEQVVVEFRIAAPKNLEGRGQALASPTQGVIQARPGELPPSKFPLIGRYRRRERCHVDQVDREWK
ncbi:unnamed protein product [Cylicocyclus nassatus]|uniref:Uncharacterized protein n=1 Tax=Cylicocyclus nassatus TaxID=53992 RepID=A0AA36DLD2_CYLNA|nr:unnamed protein product [Cylicocyclus nassatus]